MLRCAPLPRHAFSLVQACGEPNVGVNLDVFHYYTGPSKFEDLALLTPEHLAHVQVADLSGGVESFNDPGLRGRLGGQSLSQALGQALDKLFTFRVAARLPGNVESNAPTVADDGSGGPAPVAGLPSRFRRFGLS